MFYQKLAISIHEIENKKHIKCTYFSTDQVRYYQQIIFIQNNIFCNIFCDMVNWQQRSGIKIFFSKISESYNSQDRSRDSYQSTSHDRDQNDRGMYSSREENRRSRPVPHHQQQQQSKKTKKKHHHHSKFDSKFDSFSDLVWNYSCSTSIIRFLTPIRRLHTYHSRFGG